MHLTEQTNHPRPIVFPQCWPSCDSGVDDYGVNIIFQKYKKGEGRGCKMSPQQLEFYFNTVWFLCLLFVSFFLSFFVCFLSFFHFREQL